MSANAVFILRTLIAGAYSGVGQAALCRRGLGMQPFKVGPDSIGPGCHAPAAHLVEAHSHG